MGVLTDILTKKAQQQKMLVVLLDPEKTSEESLPALCRNISEGGIDMVFVGGSGYKKSIDAFLWRLRSLLTVPVVLFPGDIRQFSREADALLFLSLLSGRNAELLIGQHIRAARQIQESGIEVIPMGYVLVDGGRESAVERITGTQPLQDPAEIVNTAIAAQLLGKKLLYLEAGSGAKVPVGEEIIQQVKSAITIPLIVGGGIHSVEQMHAAFQAGADIVVIGNHFEQHPEDIVRFGEAKR